MGEDKLVIFSNQVTQKQVLCVSNSTSIKAESFWKIPQTSVELEKWILDHQKRFNPKSYLNLPNNIALLSSYIKTNIVLEEVQILKSLQDKIENAKRTKKPLVILVGSDHQIERQHQYFTSGPWSDGKDAKPGLLYLLKGLTHVGYELFKSNPLKKPISKDILLNKIETLYNLG